MNSQGLDDGGANISGGIYQLMSNIDSGKKKKNGIHKKIKPNPLERPGEPEHNQMHTVR